MSPGPFRRAAEVSVAALSPEVKTTRIALGFRVLSVVVFGLLVFGATVRVHGAGLSCPDWPLCFGQVVPEFDFRVSLEWGHRVLASVVSVGFLILGGWVLANRELRARHGAWVGGAAAVLVVQIVLGGLTVLHLLADWSVTLHLLTGNLFLFFVNWLALRLGPAPVAGGITAGLRRLPVVLFAAWFVQMGLGGYVSSNHAGLACTEWPTCNAGVWFPTWSGIVGLQLLHRLGAYVLATLGLWFVWLARLDRPLGARSRVLGLLILVQIGLGISNVWLGLPVETAVLHSAVGDLIGLTLGSIVWHVVSRPVSTTSPALSTATNWERA